MALFSTVFSPSRGSGMALYFFMIAGFAVALLCGCGKAGRNTDRGKASESDFVINTTTAPGDKFMSAIATYMRQKELMRGTRAKIGSPRDTDASAAASQNNDPDRRLEEAHDFFKHKNYESAIRELTKLLQSSELQTMDRMKARYLLSESYREAGRLEASSEQYHELLNDYQALNRDPELLEKFNREILKDTILSTFMSSKGDKPGP